MTLSTIKYNIVALKVSNNIQITIMYHHTGIKRTCLHRGLSAASLFELFSSLSYYLMSTTLFPTPPYALLDDIKHMHYACALVIRLLAPLAFSSYGYLKIEGR
jgi:hypothetical protein